MNICFFRDIINEIAKQIRAGRIIPILGSGFSAGSETQNGVVPDGNQMRNYMIKQIKDSITDIETEMLESKTFSQIALYYHECVPQKQQKQYVRENFCKVKLPDLKQKFLDINWIYVYTLNIDDAIERNSRYINVVHPNKEVDTQYLDSENCVIKLHGDAANYLLYKEDDNRIFNVKQYANSITSNESLLQKLRHDFLFCNIAFIGCSLDNEFDLATVDNKSKDGQLSPQTARYYFTNKRPGPLREIELSSYGITHTVIVDEFNDIYRGFYEAFQLSKEIPIEKIDSYKNHKMVHLSTGKDENAPYIYHGKGITNSAAGEILIPAFFIERDLCRRIIESFYRNTIHIVYSQRVSGKTYLLASIVERVRDRDVYFFDSRSTVNESIVENLLNKKNILVMFDTNSISKDTIFKIFRKQKAIFENGNNVVITVNSSDKDIISVINNNVICDDIIGYYLENKFSDNELRKINELLPQNELPQFSGKTSILDNLVKMENLFVKNGIFKRIQPKTETVKDLVFLLLLAVNEKINTEDLVKFDVFQECFLQTKATTPLISNEHTLVFEKNFKNSSETKYVLNAKYWLLDSLGRFAEERHNHIMIVQAYQEIISGILALSDKVSIYSQSLDYIMFDVINEIFQSDRKGRLGLAKQIYEGLSLMLSNNPHYFHQRAKCYIWNSGYDEADIPDLREAYRFASLAFHNFSIDYEKKKNANLEISIAHVLYTMALICSRISVILPDNIVELSKAIEAINLAILNPINHPVFSEEKRLRSTDDVKRVIYRLGVENKGNLSLKTQTVHSSVMTTIMSIGKGGYS